MPFIQMGNSMRGAKVYVVIAAAIVAPVLMAVFAHRAEKDDEKLRAILRLSRQALERQQAATSPADLIHAFRADEAKLQQQLKGIDEK